MREAPRPLLRRFRAGDRDRDRDRAADPCRTSAVEERWKGTLQTLRADTGAAPVVVEAWDHRQAEAEELVDRLDRIGLPHRMEVLVESEFFRRLERGERDPLPFRRSERWRLRSSRAWFYFPGPADLPRYLALPPWVRRKAFGGDARWWAEVAKVDVPSVRWLGGFLSRERARLWGRPFSRWSSALEEAHRESPRTMRARSMALRSKMSGPGRLWVQGEGADGSDWFVASVPQPGRSLLNLADLSLPRTDRPLVVDHPGGSLQIGLRPEGCGGTWGPVLPFALWPPYEPWALLEGTTWTLERGRATVEGPGAPDPRLRRVLGSQGGLASCASLEIGLNPRWRTGSGFDRLAQGVATLHLSPGPRTRARGLRLGLPLRMRRCLWAPDLPGVPRPGPRASPPPYALDLAEEIFKPLRVPTEGNVDRA